jgi:hypothetical protein
MLLRVVRVSIPVYGKCRLILDEELRNCFLNQWVLKDEQGFIRQTVGFYLNHSYILESN